MIRLVSLLGVLLSSALATADTPPAKVDPLVGAWKGALGAGDHALRLIATFTRGSDGAYAGMLESVDQHAMLPLGKITVSGDAVRFEVPRVGGLYEGKLKSGAELVGTWTQTGVATQPLSLSRETPKKTAAAAAPAPSPLVAPIEAVVPVAPTAFRADGKTQLVYELHVTSFSSREYTISRVEALDGERSLSRHEGLTLSLDVTRVGTEASGLERLRIGPGQRSVIFMWVTIDGAAPRSIDHKITVGPAEGGLELTLRAAKAEVATVLPLLAPPLRGARWLAGNGPSNGSTHRRALIPVAGRAHIGQRYAIDWVQLGADDKSFAGPAKENRSYHSWGKDALAVAAGTVVEVKDGIPENVPGARAVPITLETIGGNHVTIDLGNGRYAFYAHLQPGSLKVRLGERVRRGQVLGLVGNSGNSSEPHLHFHVSDGVSPLGSEGQPYVFESYETEEQGKRSVRRGELPLEGQLVAFPD